MPFPPDPPSDLGDPDAIRSNDWQAFLKLPHMETHWNRPGWTPGRRSYHWMLTFDETGELRRLAAECQDRLNRPELDLTAPDAMHLTLGRVAFTDEISTEAVSTIAHAADDLQFPFDLEIGPITGSRGALRFSVSPWTQLVTLHDRLSRATRSVLGDRCVMNTSDFRPHIGIAYANTRLAVPELVPVLTDLRTRPTARATIDSASLVELRREGYAYRFNIEHRAQAEPTTSPVRYL